MVAKPFNRRATDQVPLGIECALPWVPTPPSLARQVKQASPARKLLLGVAALLLVTGAWLFGQGLWIQAKAQLAQLLVRGAWERTLAGERQVKPWPWADTWPVARLALSDKSIDLYVLAGANGRTIAFGPGHMFGSALPGENGNSVIGGHRDTHLAFLRDVKPGAELRAQRADGQWRSYRVRSGAVLDEKDVWVTRQDGKTRMTLITCYPFDAIRSGGPQRYVVFADAIEKKG